MHSCWDGEALAWWEQWVASWLLRSHATSIFWGWMQCHRSSNASIHCWVVSMCWWGQTTEWLWLTSTGSWDPQCASISKMKRPGELSIRESSLFQSFIPGVWKITTSLNDARVYESFRWPLKGELLFILVGADIQTAGSAHICIKSYIQPSHMTCVHCDDFSERSVFSHPFLSNSFCREWGYKGWLFSHLSHSGILLWCSGSSPMSHLHPVRLPLSCCLWRKPCCWC